MRNRGKKEFLKIKKNNKEIKDINGNKWLIDKQGWEKVLLTRKRENDKYGSPACPLIMAGYASEQKRRGFKSSLNIYYIGEDNRQNIPNYYIIEKGKKVAEILGTKIDVKNVYFSDEILSMNFEVKK